MNARLFCWILSCCAVSPLAHAISSTYTVTSNGSGGTCTAGSTTDPKCTLDTAIADATSGSDIIHFSAAVQTQTIRLTDINTLTVGVTIDASPNGVVLDGGNSATIFYFQSGTFVLSHLTLQHGLGGNSGGAIYNSGGSVTIDSCTLIHNAANGGGGGAILNVSGSITIINSTIADNTAAYGGGIAADSGVVISNSTITGNSSTNEGGGISGYGFTLSSSIVAGNTATTAPDIDGSEAVSLGYNLIGNSSGSGLSATTGDQFDVDPLFVSAGLASNGGATQTIALQSASPARSSGNCAGNASNPTIPAVTLDQRGFTRGTPCTIGAFDMTSIFYNGFEE